MRLKSVKFTNFRVYRATTVVPIDEDMTGIVGRNGYGKSTILATLAILFESCDVNADKSDMNCFSLSSVRYENQSIAVWSACEPRRGCVSACIG